MFVKFPAELLRVPISNDAKILYTLLLMYRGQHEYAFPSQRTMAKDLNTTPRSVRAWLKELVEYNLITFVEVKRGESLRYNVLTVQSEAVSDPGKKSTLVPVSDPGKKSTLVPVSDPGKKEAVGAISSGEVGRSLPGGRVDIFRPLTDLTEIDTLNRSSKQKTRERADEKQPDLLQAEAPLPEKQRRSNTVVEAISEVTGMDWKIGTNGARLGMAAAGLGKAGYTADDVREFGRRYALQHPISSTPTLKCLQEQIGMVRRPFVGGSSQQQRFKSDVSTTEEHARAAAEYKARSEASGNTLEAYLEKMPETNGVEMA